jgi:mycothione reductase
MDGDIRRRFTERMSTRVSLRLNRTIRSVAPLPAERVQMEITDRAGAAEVLRADLLLVATGRGPNSDRLDLDRAEVLVDDAGFVVVDEYQRTSADGVFALGDVCSPRMLKHVANHEARIVQHNLLHPEAMRAADHRFIPAGVFSDPQVAAVGLSEDDARQQRVGYVTSTAEYGSTAYGWAMEDTEHFCKLLADPNTGNLLGGHIIGPQAIVLLQPIIQAMSFGVSARGLAEGQYWPHPALSEVVENALLDLPLD